MSLTPAGGWPSIERTALEDSLRAALAAGGVFLVGEAGSGKTVLAQRVVASLGRRMLHLRGTALSAEVPYGTLQAILAHVDDGQLTHPSAVVRAVRDELSARFGAGEVIVFADNAQQIDEATAHVLALLAESGDIRLLIAGTSVLDGPRAFAELWRDRLLRTLEVPPFTVDEVAQAATLYLGSPVVLAAVTTAHESTEGNPLYLGYLLREWVDGGSLTLTGGVWALANPGEPSSPRFVDLIAAQLSRWSPGAREALELVALTEEFPVGLLLEIVEPDDLDALERAGVVIVDVDGAPTVRIRNRFVAQIIRQSIPFGRRRALRERVIATGVDPDAGTAEQRLAFAVWSIECGVSLDPEFAVRAAETALELFDAPLALRIAGSVPPGPSFARASIARSVALRYLGLRENAAQALADLGTAQRSELAPELTVALAVEESTVLAGLEGRGGYALDVLGSARLAVQAVPADDAARLDAVLDVAEYEVLLVSGRHLELIEPLGAVYDAGPSAGLRRWAAASAIYAEALAVTGRQQEALRILGELTPVAADPGLDRATVTVVRASLFGCLVSCGLWRQALEFLTEAETVGREPLVTGSVIDTLVGLLHLYSGRPAAALPALLAAHSQAAVRDPYLSRGQIVAGLAWTTALLGRPDEARDHLVVYGSGRYAPFHAVASAELCAWSARLELGDDAESAVLDRAQAYRDAGQPAEAVLLLASLAGHGSDPALAQLRAGVVEEPGPLAEALGDFAEGAFTTDAALLLRAAERFADIGHDAFALHAALAAAAVPGADRALVRDAQRVAKLARAAIGGDAAVIIPEKLSAREREVAELAARRLSNQEIAERLHLSIRTVESYLQSVFGKLGINSRADLPELLAVPVP